MIKNRQKAFTPFLDDVKKHTELLIAQTIGANKYSTNRVQPWVDQITHDMIQHLRTLNDEFKYVVSVIIMEKKLGGFHLFSTCYWDCDQDGTVTARYDNQYLHVLVTIFGITLD